MTFRSPPLTVDQLQILEQDMAPRFSSSQAFVDSWQACKDWYGEKHYTITVEGAREWMERDLEQDKVLHFRFAEVADPLAESHPQQAVEVDEKRLRAYVAAGDVHNWYFVGGPDGDLDEPRQSMLPVERHVKSCPRCQLGIRSRDAADAHAIVAGKRPLPGIGATLQRLYGDSRQRCDACGAMEDQPSPEECPRSFWHLPDVWTALHPGSAPPDMGQLGPFMRFFLRRQRPES